MKSKTLEEVFNEIITTKRLSEAGYKVLFSAAESMARNIISCETTKFSKEDMLESIAFSITSIVSSLCNKGIDEKIENPKGYIYRTLKNQIYNSQLNFNNKEHVKFRYRIKEIIEELENQGECCSYMKRIVDCSEHQSNSPLPEYEIEDFIYAQDLTKLAEGEKWTVNKTKIVADIIKALLSKNRSIDTDHLIECLEAKAGIRYYEVVDLYSWNDDGMQISYDKDSNAVSATEEMIYESFLNNTKCDFEEFLARKTKEEIETLKLHYVYGKNLREIAEYLNISGTSTIDYYINKPKNRKFFRDMGYKFMSLDLRPDTQEMLKKRIFNDLANFLDIFEKEKIS